jgi:ligand-binding sensor protein
MIPSAKRDHRDVGAGCNGKEATRTGKPAIQTKAGSAPFAATLARKLMASSAMAV